MKLLVHIEEDDAREILCDTHFDALEKKVSSKIVLRPTLPAGGLVSLSRGQLSKWTSPVMYWAHNFGKDNSAGPGNGWNLTTIRKRKKYVGAGAAWKPSVDTLTAKQYGETPNAR